MSLNTGESGGAQMESWTCPTYTYATNFILP